MGTVLPTARHEGEKIENYTYRLPDHWILPLLPTRGLWVLEHEAYVERTVELVCDSRARTVLEIGCGDGWNCAKLAERGLVVAGVDWSVNGTDYARRLVPGATIVCGDISDPGFRAQFPDPFDAVIMVEVIEHIPPADAVGVLKLVRQCVKKGGRLVLTTPSVNQRNTNPLHFRHFTAEILRDELAQAEFKLTSAEGYGDVRFEKWFWQLVRYVDNRYWTIYPLKNRAYDYYRRHYTRKTPLDRSRGLIITAEAV